MRLHFLSLIFALPLTAIAEDRWVEISPASPPLDATLLNVGHVVKNSVGNPVATIRSVTKNGGFRLEVITEFDCSARRTRSIGSVLTDKDGHPMGGDSKISNYWFSGKDAIGLDVVCNSPSVPR